MLITKVSRQKVREKTDDNQESKSLYTVSLAPADRIKSSMIKVRDTVICETPQLSIYNTQGRLVRMLVDEKKKAGQYTIVWDGKDENGERLPTGIYFCKVKVDNYTKIHKILLTR